MTINSSRRRTIADSLEEMYGLKLTEDNLKNLREHFLYLLKQYHLLSLYEPEEILNEVGSRFKNTLQKGKNVPKPKLQAWARSTGRNIIREQSRKEKKYRAVGLNEWEVATDENISLSVEKQEEFERVHDALKKLSAETQQLLKLRFFQGLSWQEITLHLTQNGQKISVATIRKRGERSINQLREVYFEKFL